MPSRRAQIEMTHAELHAFLGEQMVMQCATNGPRGLPHLVPLWFVTDGDELLSWTYAKSQKAKNLERSAQATLGIEDGVQYHELRGVMLECDVELERDAAAVEGYGLRLFERYAGEVGPEIRDDGGGPGAQAGGSALHPVAHRELGSPQARGRLLRA